MIDLNLMNLIQLLFEFDCEWSCFRNHEVIIMRVVFENQSTATESYPMVRQEKVDHNGRSYTKVGASSASLSTLKRFYYVVLLVGDVCMALFKRNWESVKQRYEEITTGREKVIHCVPFLSAPVGQREAVVAMAQRIKEDCRYRINLEMATDSTCFLHLKFEHGESRHQFIIKPAFDRLHNLSMDFEIKIDRIPEKLSHGIQSQWGALKSYDWMVFSLNNMFYDEFIEGGGRIDLDRGIAKTRCPVFSNDLERNRLSDAWLVAHQCEMQELDWNREFVQGLFYQELAPATR